MAHIMGIWKISQVTKCVGLVSTARLDEFYGSISVFFSKLVSTARLDES